MLHRRHVAICVERWRSRRHFSRRAIDVDAAIERTHAAIDVRRVPGVVVTDSTGTLAQFTAGGQRRFANRLTIDGMSADLAVDLTGPGMGQASTGSLPAFSTTGSTQTLVPLAAIDEIEVRTTNAPPEHQRAPGAQTSIVTRAGGDRTNAVGIHGLPSECARRLRLVLERQPRGAQTPRQLLERRRLARRPRAVRLESPLSISRAANVNISTPADDDVSGAGDEPARTATPAVRPLLDAFPRAQRPRAGQRPRRADARISRRIGLSAFSLRVDGNLTDRHRLFTRINRGTSGGDELGPLSRRRASRSRTGEAAATNTATAGLTSVFCVRHARSARQREHPRRLTHREPRELRRRRRASARSARAAGARNDAWVRVQSLGGPGGFVIEGRGAAGRQEQFQVADTWTWLKGRHEWRFGVDFRRVTTSTDAAEYSLFLSLLQPD